MARFGDCPECDEGTIMPGGYISYGVWLRKCDNCNYRYEKEYR